MRRLIMSIASGMLGLAALLTLLIGSPVGGSDASSHRESPLILGDPLADATDLYAFVSPDNPDTVTLIANWVPLEEPSDGPNFYAFGDAPQYVYGVDIDNNGDAVEDTPGSAPSWVRTYPRLRTTSARVLRPTTTRWHRRRSRTWAAAASPSPASGTTRSLWTWAPSRTYWPCETPAPIP
jgi:hypothetical protein